MTMAEEPVPKSGLAAEGLPDYVVSGTWTMDDAGRWSFSDGKRIYAGEWAAVWNPYADPAAGQKEFDWFRFDGMGFLVCGWYTDPDGSTYYLNPGRTGQKEECLPAGTGSAMMRGTNSVFILMRNPTAPEAPCGMEEGHRMGMRRTAGGGGLKKTVDR